jgi:hypothetical protein
MNEPEKLKRNIRRWILLFVVLLILSGITAFPLQWELKILVGCSESMPEGVAYWIKKVNDSLADTYSKYPFIAYGTDWLAFAHIIIGIGFIGPLRDPVKNIWVIESGMIACVLVIPLALIAGPIRHIPFFWRVIDCSFGIFGIIPLWIVRNKIKRLESILR